MEKLIMVVGDIYEIVDLIDEPKVGKSTMRVKFKNIDPVKESIVILLGSVGSVKNIIVGSKWKFTFNGFESVDPKTSKQILSNFKVIEKE